MAATEASIPAALGERARLKPDTPAYTFIDYEIDPDGYSQTLTWSQLYQRVRVVPGEIASCTSPGDRVTVLAPQGLDSVIGFSAAMGARCIAVPLPVATVSAPERPTGRFDHWH